MMEGGERESDVWDKGDEEGADEDGEGDAGENAVILRERGECEVTWSEKREERERDESGASLWWSEAASSTESVSSSSSDGRGWSSVWRGEWRRKGGGDANKGGSSW
jgi:hypothetical protein